MNVQYVPDQGHNRIPMSRSVDTTYRFYAHIFQGVEIGRESGGDGIKSNIELKIGRTSKNTNQLFKTAEIAGAFPKYDTRINQQILLNRSLEFAPDMVVYLNANKSILTGTSTIGEFQVPAISMQESYKKPQYFNFL